MPCHPARARELVKKNKAVRRFNKGIFYIKLLERCEGVTQDVACGIDPGSRKEGYTVKSDVRTFLNVQSDAVTWVKKVVEIRRNMRKARRNRKTPFRKNKVNRKRGSLPPSTKARWQWKLRISKWLSNLYPITCFVVEDLKAHTYGGRKWNTSFSPLQVGKNWFYLELAKITKVILKLGFETKQLRDSMGLKKTKKKLSEVFEAHCVDSWVLANSWVGGHTKPDNKSILFITPLRFYRRQLHRLQPAKNGIRKRYGGTFRLGFKKGSIVKHKKYNNCYVSGFSNTSLSLRSLENGKLLTQKAKLQDTTFLSYNSWRVRQASSKKR